MTEASADNQSSTPQPDPPIVLSRKKKALLAFLMLLVLFGSLEIVLRIIFPRIAWPTARVIWDGGADLKPDRSEWPTTYPKGASGVHTYIEFAVPVTFNSDGFRDDEFDPDAGPVVIFLGDSTVAGHGIEFDETFVYRVEQALQARFGDIQVWNLGRSGSGPVVQTLLLERILAKYPTADVRAVVLISGLGPQNGAGNDLTDMERNFAFLEGGRPGPSAPKAFRPQYLLRRSAILHGCEILLSQWRRENWRLPTLKNWDELWQMYYTCLDKLRAICDARDADLIVTYLSGWMTELPADIEDVTQRMRQYLDPEDIPLVSCVPKLAPELQGKLWYYPIDGHVNVLAHEHCAEQLTPVIIETLAKRPVNPRSVR